MTSQKPDDLRTPVSSEQESAGALPRCCQSGCTVCVLDYPELFLTHREGPEPDLRESSEMLNAIRLAQVLLESLGSETTIIEPETQGGM